MMKKRDTRKDETKPGAVPEGEHLEGTNSSNPLEDQQDVEEELTKLIEQNETQASAYKKILNALKALQDEQKKK